MKRAWSGLVLGIGALPAVAATCEHASLQGEVQGKFDASGEVCFLLPELTENYVSVTLNGVTDARLLDGKNRRIRTLVENGPVDGEHTLLFALPVKQSTSLVLHGEAGKPWRFQWRMKETYALPRVQMLEPESPTLQALAKTVAAGGSTDAFWQAQALQGTPMVEPVDATHKRVTFLWRGARENVFLSGSPAGEHDPLFRLGNSDVWFRSYVVPADTVMQYKLAPDVPFIGGSPRDRRRSILVNAQADPLNPDSFGEQKGDRWRRSSLLDLSPARYCSAQAAARPLTQGTLSRQTFTSTLLGNARDV